MLEGKENPSILKDEFSSRTDPSVFISILPKMRYSNDELKQVEFLQH